MSRVLLVCIGAPLPMVVFVSALALVPLQEPAAGCSANFGFWIRSGILAFTVAHTLTIQAKYHIDGVTISTSHQLLLSVMASLLFSAGAIAISQALIFPVPFFVLTMCPVFYVALITSYRIILGARIFRQILESRDKTIRYVSFVGAQNVMVFTYPAYEALFHAVKGSQYQLPAILLLPIIKMAMKNLVLRCLTNLEDMMPEAVIFTVDFFNAIYVATSVQSASSVAAIIAITVTDLSQTIIMLCSLHQRTMTLLPRLLQTVENEVGVDSVLNGLCALCRNPNLYRRNSRKHIFVRSCISHSLTATSRQLLTRLECIPSGVSSDLFKSPGLLKLVSSPSVYTIELSDRNPCRKVRSIFVQRRRETIYPITLNTIVSSGPANNGKSDSRAFAEGPTILREALETLFTTECIIFTAYLEAIIPFFYCSYMLVMVRLPNSRYHTEMAGVTPDNVVATIFPVFIFGFLQVATFLVLAAVINRNCGTKMMYQLAFVLETQKPLVQGKFMFWVLIMLCFRIVHFGACGKLVCITRIHY
ncbi:unnamed protein product [Phytophthora fragariaefolia]|uniref:Unnamed protein product n=1 Tax=Phytophthora fragariaefolia TaxID=1490495 RepID=A0A9W6Y237_9STRA|nr:unnamed protein product [Phytophthora fragariaefolia]